MEVMVTFTPQPLYPQYPLDRRLGGPQKLRRIKSLLLLSGIEGGPSGPEPIPIESEI
jgi:hypothetical protein